MADIEKERADFQAWLESDDSPFTTRMHKSYGPEYVERAERDAAWEAWAKRAAVPRADAAEMKRLADALDAEATQAHITGPTARAAAALLRRMAGG